MKEIGSIGTGNAATALSSMLQTEVRMEVPRVELLGFTEAVDHVGDPGGYGLLRVGRDAAGDQRHDAFPAQTGFHQ